MPARRVTRPPLICRGFCPGMGCDRPHFSKLDALRLSATVWRSSRTVSWVRTRASRSGSPAAGRSRRASCCSQPTDYPTSRVSANAGDATPALPLLSWLGASRPAARRSQHRLRLDRLRPSVRQWTCDLVFFTHVHPISDRERGTLYTREIAVVDGEVERLLIDGDRLRGVLLADGRSVPRVAVFIRPALRAHPDGLATGSAARRSQEV